MTALPYTFAIPNADTITRTTFDNGLTLLVYEKHSAQSVVIAGSIQAGSLHETPEQSGLASLTANGLMRGTKNQLFEALHTRLEDIGADLNTGAGRHATSFSGKCLAEDLPVLIDVLQDVLRYPVFPDDMIEQDRLQRLTRLKYSEQDTRTRAGRAFRQAVYPIDHPYHYTSYGSLETLPNITPDDIRAFHAQQYGPQDMVLTVVGAVNTQALIDLIGQALGDWTNPQQQPEPALPALPPIEAQRVYIGIPEKTQADIVIGTAGPSRFAEDYMAASLANSILGEFGMMGRIGNVIREEAGLAYYAYSRLDGGHGPGAWSVAAGVAPDDVEAAIDMALTEIRRITSERVSDEELADNQSYYSGRLPLRLESNAGIAMTIQAMERYNLGLDYLKNYDAMIYSYNAQDILAAAHRYLNPDALVIAVAGPE